MDNKNIRIRTNVGVDSELTVKLEQDFDFIEVLSVKISQDDAYRRFSSDYGVIVGRCLSNGGFGIPNAKVSVFIPITDEDKLDDSITRIYPYEVITDKDFNGVRYNLLSPECNPNECHTPIGTFPTKNQLLDNEVLGKIHEKYYKYTTSTNESGDYMIFGVPIGNQIVHVDVDISDIGIFSQKPINLINNGVPENLFESTTKFKQSKNLDSLPQVKSVNSGINVIPFWGDTELFQIGISRLDIDLNLDITPTALFTGSMITDSNDNAIRFNCKPKNKTGKMSQLSEGNGLIEMIRKTANGDIEQFDISNSNVDEFGVWNYEIPLNLDKYITDEFGNLVPSNDSNIGIATRASVRFRIGLDDINSAKYLVPNNVDKPNYDFSELTPNEYFADIFWNKIYSIKNFIPRFQANKLNNERSYIGFKDLESDSDSLNKIPYNKNDFNINPLVTLLSVISNNIALLVLGINSSVIFIVNRLIDVVNIFANIDPIPCITLECNGSKYAPGCIGKSEKEKLLEVDPTAHYPNDGHGHGLTSGYVECVCANLNDQFNSITYNFFNDWINGVLYFPKIEFKNKGSKVRYCDYNNKKFNASSVNKSYNSYILYDGSGNGNSLTKIEEGIVIENEGDFYYAQSTHDKSVILLASDIIELGSFVKDDWQNKLIFANLLPQTTYKELSNNREFDGSNLIQNGQDPLFYNVLICGLPPNQNQQNLTNLSRFCELGVGYDEDRSDETKNALGIGGGTPDGVIDATDIENLLIRDLFVKYNSTLDINPLDTFDSSKHVLFNTNYSKFKDFNGRQSRNSSLYFYFGLRVNKTAINKVKFRYLNPCLGNCKRNKIKVTANIVNAKKILTNNGFYFGGGSIMINIFGATEPITYFWEGPNNFTSNEKNIFDLISGEYKLTVIDKNGNIVKKTLYVNEPLGLASDFTVINLTSFNSNNGNIFVGTINGGLSPYSVKTLDNSNILISDITLPVNSNSVYVTGDNPSNGTLKAGTYKIIITDSNNDSFEINAEVTQPQILQLEVTKVNITCNGNDNGQIRLKAIGGTPPYTYLTTNDSIGYSNQLQNQQLLTKGIYTTKVTDSNNEEVIKIVEIIEPDKLIIKTNSVINANGPLNNGSININITGGNPMIDGSSYYLKLFKNEILFFEDSTLDNNYVFDLLERANYKIIVSDDKGCESNELMVTIN